MFDKHKAFTNAEQVGLDDLFKDSDIEVSESPVTRKSTVARVSKGVAGLVSLSVVAGILFSVYPIMALSGAAVVAEPAVEVWKSLPSELDDLSIAQRNTFYDKNGSAFAEVWSEDRITVDSLDKISQYAKDGLIATEDQRFLEHGGIDARGTVRAALSGSGGGSGITQQLVKNLQFYNQAGVDQKDKAVERSYNRKLKELKLAMEYEKTHSKDEILLSYFNTVAFGSPNTYSLEASAQYFFGKSAADLDLAESAALVGSANNPVKYDLSNADKTEDWKARQAVVLDRMVAEDKVTSEEAEAAKVQELVFVKKKATGNCTSSKYPFYCEYVLEHLQNSPKLGETPEERAAVLSKGGLQIRTYLDPQAMDTADARLEADFGNLNRVVAPVAIVQPGTGGVEAIAVNREYGEGEGATTINVPDNPAATGSTYKMIALAAALNSGFTEANLSFASQCPFAPSGFDYPAGGFKNSVSCAMQGGFMDYKKATALSSNTWFTTLATKTGMEPIFDLSRQMNLNVPEGVGDRSLSFVLGAAENSPIDMAAAFATFANEGVFCPANPVESYSYADGSVPAIPDSYNPEDDACKRVMSPYAASVVLKAMKANTYAGEVPNAFGNVAQVQGYDVVGKSGTNETYNFIQAHVAKNHSLFINIYDMDMLTNGVYGNSLFRGAYGSLNMSGIEAADIMRGVLAGKPNQALNFNSNDRTLPPVVIEKRDYFHVPSVNGMKPEAALETMKSLGIPAHVNKEKIKATGDFPSGVVIEQSPAAGTELPVGTKKEVVLTVSE